MILEFNLRRKSQTHETALKTECLALVPVGITVCGRLSRQRSTWTKLEPINNGYIEAMVSAMEWGVPKGHKLYELFLHNPPLWMLPSGHTSTDCHDLLRNAIAGALEEPVLVWMGENQGFLAELQVLKPVS